MKTALALMLALSMSLAACKGGGGYMNTKDADPPEPVPEDDEADWRLYGQTPEFDTKMSYDSLETVESDGYSDELSYVWAVREFKKDQESKFANEDDYRKEYTRFVIDCSKRKMAGIAVERQDSEGNETSRRDVPGFQWEFEPATAGSYQADFMNQICNLAKEKMAKSE